MKQKQRLLVSWSPPAIMATGGIVAVLGLAVMVGWYAQNVTLVQVLPNKPPMRYNTALGFLLNGTNQ